MEEALGRIRHREDLIAALVADIDGEEFQARYRRKPYKAPVTGWAARLEAYFWPEPAIDLAATIARLAPLMDRGRTLAEASRPWDAATRDLALRFATEVFAWGGVPQRNLEWEQIDLAVQAALHGERLDEAPMNSGRTKLAAFVTAHLENENRSQAIWDSRVSWSLVRRSDRILHHAGYVSVPDWLKGIGRVPGRGGTRWKELQKLKWPYGYARWESHLAASDLVRGLRDELNRRGMALPDRPLQGTRWTVRLVEMVLFMDGY